MHRVIRAMSVCSTPALAMMPAMPGMPMILGAGEDALEVGGIFCCDSSATDRPGRKIPVVSSFFRTLGLG